MALDFPANPTNGQTFGSYIWSSSKGVWQAREESGAVSIVSSVAPTSAKTGDIWVDSSDGIAYFYYYDGSSYQWVELMSSGVPQLSLKADKTYVDSQDLLKANISGQAFTGALSSSSSITGTTPVNGGSSGGLVVRTPPSGTQTSAFLQFVNNANTIQYGAISVDTNSKMTISVPVTIPQQPVYSGTLQYVGSGTNFYPVTYDTFITGFSKSGNNRLTAQTAGKYYVAVQQLINGGAYLCIFKNGSEIAHAYSNADDTYDMNVSALIDLQVNDYVEIYYHGGNLTYAWGDAHSRYTVFKVS